MASASCQGHPRQWSWSVRLSCLILSLHSFAASLTCSLTPSTASPISCAAASMESGNDEVASLRLTELSIAPQSMLVAQQPVSPPSSPPLASDTDFIDCTLTVAIRSTTGCGPNGAVEWSEEFRVRSLVADSYLGIQPKHIGPFHLSLDRLHFLISARSPSLPSSPDARELGWVYPGGPHAKSAYCFITTGENFMCAVSTLNNHALLFGGPANFTFFLRSPLFPIHASIAL